MSTDPTKPIGGKGAADRLIAESRELLRAERAKARQLDLLDPVTPEEMAEAQEELGRNAGTLAVLNHARAARRGRPKGSRNRRTDDFAKFILSFGQHPAVTMMQIQATAPEVLMERSSALDNPKRKMTYGEAQALRVRCAEGLMPYIESKKPVAVDVSVDGDFNLLIPGVNLTQEEAGDVAAGQFMLGEWEEVEGPEGEGDGHG